MSSKRNYVLIEDYNDILMYLDYNSSILFDYVRENKSQDNFVLIRKYLTHSDISTRGKPGKAQKSKLSKTEYKKRFILYYDSLEELMSYEKLPTAAQSNIGMPDEFYRLLGIPTFKENDRKLFSINQTWSKFLPIDVLSDFNVEEFEKIQIYNKKNLYSKQILDEISSFDFNDFKSKNDKFYIFDKLTIAAHGLGVESDLLLNYFRTLTFKGDVINILFDRNQKNMFIFFERNEKYYELKAKIDNLPIAPPIWKEYSEEDKKVITLMLYSMDKVEGEIQNEDIEIGSVESDKLAQVDKVLNKYFTEYNKTIEKILVSGEKPKYRWYQKKWREVLIKLDEVAFNSKGYAFCAISGLKGKYEKLGRFFVASHIKPYSDCVAEADYQAAFDPHNGLILSANVDALFDQYLISIDVVNDGLILKKDVVNSISRVGSIIYKNKINSQYLTPKRIEYLKLHKIRFDTE
jgi:hypothetical protein